MTLSEVQEEFRQYLTGFYIKYSYVDGFPYYTACRIWTKEGKTYTVQIWVPLHEDKHHIDVDVAHGSYTYFIYIFEGKRKIDNFYGFFETIGQLNRWEGSHLKELVETINQWWKMEAHVSQ